MGIGDHQRATLFILRFLLIIVLLKSNRKGPHSRYLMTLFVVCSPDQLGQIQHYVVEPAQ